MNKSSTYPAFYLYAASRKSLKIYMKHLKKLGQTFPQYLASMRLLENDRLTHFLYKFSDWIQTPYSEKYGGLIRQKFAWDEFSSKLNFFKPLKIGSLT